MLFSLSVRSPFLFTSSSLPFLFLFFTAEVAPYLISLSTPPPPLRFLALSAKASCFFFFFFPSLFFLFLFTTAAFVQSVNTSNEAFVAFFSPRVFFASLSTRPLLSQLPLLRRVCRRPPHPRVRQALPLLCQSIYIYMYVYDGVREGGGKSTKNFNTSKIRRKEKRTFSKFRVESKFIQSCIRAFRLSTLRYALRVINAGLSYLRDYPR